MWTLCTPLYQALDMVSIRFTLKMTPLIGIITSLFYKLGNRLKSFNLHGLTQGYSANG